MKSTHRTFRAIFLALCLLYGAGPIFAQGTNLGTIRGTVTDLDGAVIVNAKVEVTDLVTNISRELTSDKEGNYEAAGLKSGNYRINITSQGFKMAIINDVVLRSTETIRVDARLQAGGTTETIEVAATAGAINLETPTVSGTLTSQEILQLPRDNRDIYSFLYLNPNITQGVSDGTFKFIGAQSYGASFSLDGQRTNGGIFGEATSSQPSLESIGELVVLSNNFTAEYAGIANIRIETRRGTKDYHGSIFYNNRNSALAAWTIQDKRGQALFTPTPVVTEFPTPYFNLNETGGSIGGPIPFSKKTFFMAAYERRWSAAPVRFRNQTLPHATLYTGDFTKVNDAAKPSISILPAGVTLTPEEIANNTVLVGSTRRFTRIPQRLLNPTTQAFIKNYFPATSVNAPINPANGRLVDFFENKTGQLVRDLATLRVDHDLTSKDKISGVYNTQFVDQSNAAVVSPFVGLGLRHDDRSNHTLSLSYTHIFSDNIINEARGGFNFQYLFRNSNTTPTSFLESIGFDKSDIEAYFSVVGENARPTYGHVGVNFGGNFVTFGTGGRNTFRPLDQKLFTFGDTLTWVTGRHTIKGGFDIVRNSAQDGFANNRGNPRGLLNYTTGIATERFSRLLMGLPATTVSFVSTLRPPMEVYNWEHGYFVQDDFKLSPKLTLYLGLRYELITPFIETRDLLVNFDPDFRGTDGKRGRFIVPSRRTLTQIDPRIVAYGVVTADEVDVGRALVETDKNNFAPRLGLAWRLGEKTVLRGGFGMFYPTAAAQGMRDALATNSFNQGRTKNNTVTPLAGWPGSTHGFSPFSGGTLVTIGSQPSANAVPVGLRSPRFEQFNATFEHELFRQIGVRVSYLGTRSKGLILGSDLNMLPPSDTPFGTTTGDGVTPCDPSEGNCDLSPAEEQRLPFPFLGDFLLSYGNFGRGRSDALQVEVNRRFAGGFMFNASYTLLDQKSSAADTGNSSLGGTAYNQFKPENDFGTEGFVSRHRFVAYGVFEVPYGKGRKYGSTAPTAVDLLAGGWQVSWNMFAKSGYGFTPWWGCNNCSPATLGNIFVSSIDPIGGFSSSGFRPLVVGDPNQQSGDRYFNPDALGLPPVGADVFDNPNVAKRNLLRGPGAWGANLGVSKNFRFGEKVSLRLGAEFNNIFNHPLLAPDFGTGIGISNLGSFDVRVNPTTKKVDIDPASVDRNLNFGRFFDSFSQENIDNRRAIRITLRLTF